MNSAERSRCVDCEEDPLALPSVNVDVLLHPIAIGQIHPLIIRKGGNVFLPARTPADVPFPDASQDGARVPVVVGPEFTFFAFAHRLILNIHGHVLESGISPY